MAKLMNREFNMLQELYCESFHNLSNVDHKMEAETETNSKKSMGRNKRPKEGIKKKRCLMIYTLFSLCYYACYQNG